MSACHDFYTGHEALAPIVEAIAGTRWRFLVTHSDRGIDMRHKDDMYAEFWESVAKVKSSHGAFGKEEYEHLVRDVIDNSFLKHKRISLFLTDDDNLIPFDRSMALAFNGSGYACDDGEIVSGDDDDAIGRMM